MKHRHACHTQSDWRRDDCQSTDDGDYLRVKPSMSIISILSIHLLQTFINAANLSEKQMMWQCIIHLLSDFRHHHGFDGQNRIQHDA